MQIKITTTLNIAKANEGLIPLITQSLSHEAWAAEKLSQDENADVSHETFIKYYLAKDHVQRLRNIIEPQLDRYFGIVMQAQATAVKGQLSTAITSVVDIAN